MIKILTSHHVTPDVRSLRTLYFERVLPLLRTTTKVHIIWLVYMPDKLKSIKSKELDVTILDIHDFNNAVEVIQKIKPDVIHAAPYPNLPDYALALAGKYLKIPVFGEVVNQLFVEDRLTKMIRLNVSAFLEKSVPTDVGESKKQFMRRGRFWVYKYKFLLRTQLAIKMKKIEIIKKFFTILEVHFSIWKKRNDSRFAVDYHFVEGKLLVKKLIREGFKESSLFLTGHPVYDPVFERANKIKPRIKNDNKIRVLLLTHSMYEHGFWTKEQRDNVASSIVTEISKYKNEMSLVVKIHPSSENILEYKSLINPIDPSIPIVQKGDILDFIEDSDVVISYSTASGPIQAMLFKKPIIMINQNLKQDIMLERGIVQECKDITNIVQLIKKVLVSNPATESKIKEFIEDYIAPFDGRSAQRVSEAIFQLSQKKNISFSSY